MTDTDPYTGIRTRENIVAAPVEVEAEFSGGSVDEHFENVQRVIAARPPVVQLGRSLRQHLSANSAQAMEEIDAEAARGMGGNTSGGQGGSGGGGSYARVTTRWAGIEYREPPPTPKPPPVVDPARAFELNYVPAEDLPAHERIDQLKALVENMLHDWRKLNEFFNTTAVNRDWCEEYEERLQRYNESFKVLRMVGRPKNWYGSASNWASTDGDG